MNHLLNITRKELKELLTPGTIVSILVVVIMFSALGSMMSGESEDEAAPKDVGIVYAGNFDDTIPAAGITIRTVLDTAYKATYNVDNTSDYIHKMDAAADNPQAITDELVSKGYTVAIVIPADICTNVGTAHTAIDSYYSYTQGGLFSSMSTMIGATIVANMNTVIASKLIGDPYKEFPVVAGTSHTLVNGKICDDITPYEITATLMGQTMLIPIIVMIVIVMVGSVVISSMGSEKENKTLETLLTMPIRRTTIVSGKLLAAAVVGLVYGVCYLIGMIMYTNGMTSGISGAQADLAQFGLTMGPLDWVILMVVLFLSIFSALGICMILGAFTKNYKMAQTMTLPISGLALIPMFIFMFASWETLPMVGKAFIFAIPFSHPMMAMDNLMFGNITLVLAGIGYLLVFDIITILITVKTYNSDILITGLQQTKSHGKLRNLFKKEEEHEDR